MIIILVATLVGATTLGFAAAATGGVIYVCVNNSSGTIHVVSATTTCHTNETALSWNTDGPRGATGATGPAGPAGPIGPTGAAAPSGTSTTFTIRHGGMYPGTSIARAFCESDERVTGGGGISDSSSAGLTQNGPIDADGLVALGTGARGWQVASEGFGNVEAYVVCAR